MTPEQIRDWADAIDNQRHNAPTPSDVVFALYEYAELMDDMKSLVRILNKWGD